MGLEGQGGETQEGEATGDDGVDDHQGPEIVAHQDDGAQGHQGDHRHRRLAGREDPRLAAVAERRPDLGGEVVAEVAEGGEQDIGGHEWHDPRPPGPEKGGALAGVHGRAADPLGLVLGAGGR